MTQAKDDFINGALAPLIVLKNTGKTVYFCVHLFTPGLFIFFCSSVVRPIVPPDVKLMSGEELLANAGICVR